jgi:ankyrin repeat protein
MARDVFISYSSKDKTVADAVCAALESSGVSCWIAPRDILAGEGYAASLLNGLSTSTILVLVYSANSNRSPQVLREVERAVSKGLPIVPLRIEDAPMSSDMEYFISSQHWLDALTPPLEPHLDRLCDSVKVLLSRQVEDERAAGPESASESESASGSLPAAELEEPHAESAASGRRGRWIGALAVLAAIAIVLGVAVVRSRSASARPASGATSSAVPGSFLNVNNELLSAAANGDTIAAARLLGQGADVEAKNNQGDSPLLLAARSQKAEVANLLIAKGAGLEDKNDQGDTPLIAACTVGSTALTQLLVEKGADINARDDVGATPLMYAALAGNTTILDLLLAKGAAMNAADDNGKTPLMYAASAGSVDAVKRMLAKSASPAAKDHNGKTALNYAEEWHRQDVVDLLKHRKS